MLYYESSAGLALDVTDMRLFRPAINSIITSEEFALHRGNLGLDIYELLIA
jgi:hypothetical protein